MKARLLPKAVRLPDYSAFSRQQLLDLIREKDAEFASLKANFKIALGQAEVDLSFAREKLVDLIDSMLALDKEVTEQRSQSALLRQKLGETEARFRSLQDKYKECQRDARDNQILLREYEVNDEARLFELQEKCETIKALERTLEEEILFSNELKDINRDQRERTHELEDLIEKQNAALSEMHSSD